MVSSLLLLALMAPPFAWTEHPDGRLELTENGKTVWMYTFGPQLPPGVPEDRRRCCYLHPVNTPAGVTLTDDFPKDHYHHRGIFFGWAHVEVGGKVYDNWMLRGIAPRFEKFVEKKPGLLTVDTGWYVGDTRVVNQRDTYIVHPSKDGSREMEMSVTLEAENEPVILKPVKDTYKSYGGFNARFAPRTGTAMRGDTGPIVKDEDLNPHAWVEYEAVYNGKRALMRIESDPKNPAHPPQWTMRNYGFAGASFPGKSPQLSSWTLEKGKPITLRYKVILRDL